MEQAPDYGRLATVYDLLAALYSMGQTRASKLAQVRTIGADARVLIAGAGTGEEVTEAAARGAYVTVVEAAEPMVDLIRKRVDKAGYLDRTNLIVGDVTAHEAPDNERYDVVTANFLLPVFDKAHWPAVLDHLMRLVKPGGYLKIADYAPIKGPFFMRMLQAAYYAIGNFGVRITAGNVQHKPTEPPSNWYAERLEAAGFELEEMTFFRLAGIGPRWLAGWSARKPLE